VDSFGSGKGPVVVTCEKSNETLGCIRGGELLDWLSDYYLLKKDSAP